MRNSAAKHNQGTKHSLFHLWVCIALAGFTAELPAQDEGFQISSEDMIAIRADQAWEDSQPNTIHFEGNFEMRVHDWLVQADRAIVKGKLDDPVRLELAGSPARMELSHTVNGRTEKVLGEAEEIIYDRESELIYMNGTARLGQGENVLQSSSVEYDVKENRFRAAGDTGVQIQVATEE